MEKLLSARIEEDCLFIEWEGGGGEFGVADSHAVVFKNGVVVVSGGNGRQTLPVFHDPADEDSGTSAINDAIFCPAAAMLAYLTPDLPAGPVATLPTNEAAIDWLKRQKI